MDKELSRILDESIQLELNVADLYLSFCHAFAPGGHLKTGQLWPGQNRPAAGRFLVNHFLYF